MTWRYSDFMKTTTSKKKRNLPATAAAIATAPKQFRLSLEGFRVEFMQRFAPMHETMAKMDALLKEGKANELLTTTQQLADQAQAAVSDLVPVEPK